ncbi:MAG: hypothetical protein ACKVOK_05420, partial [Flavobacteriales bacterium]
IDEDKPLPGNPDVMFISELAKTSGISSTELDYLRSKTVVVGNAISEGKTSFLLKNVLESSQLYCVKDGAVILDKLGVINHMDWFENNTKLH